MAQVVSVVDSHGVDEYMPSPLAARHEIAYQWVQMTVPLIGAVLAVLHTVRYGMAPGTLVVTFVLSVLTGLGITVGFHRLFTHRSFETVGPVRIALAVLGSMAAQGTLFTWVASHRRHHQFSDKQGDPHSPNIADPSSERQVEAFFHSHLGWMLTDHMTPDRLRYVPDFLADPMLCRIQRWHLLWVALGLILPALACYAIDGTAQAAVCGFLWGGLVRIAVTQNISFAVNSVGHLWGERPFDSQDESRNNGVVAFLSMGEGWHNNHHAFPTSARHGLQPGQWDASYRVIRLLELCGLAWDVKTPTGGQLEAKARGAS